MTKNDTDVRYEFVRAFQYKGINFWGGDVDDVIISGPFDLIISLSTLNPPKIEASAPESFKAFKASITIPDILKIDWKNDIPQLPMSCWEALVTDIKNNSDLLQDIAVCCSDGTGKTGVALAILRALLLEETGDPVENIRNSYSPQAVHTDNQVDYVAYITQLESSCDGSKSTKKK